jgi:sugar phosphate isomerase/epimerase
MALTHPLGMQLYSARKFPPFEDAMAIIAGAGYANVETFGAFYDDVEAARSLFDRYGVSVKSGHFDLDMALNDFDRVVGVARRLGMEFVIAPYLAKEQRPVDRAGWRALGETLATLSRKLAAEGLRFAWHNHDFEFQSLPDGSHPIDHILGDELLWEADLAWVARGGADPGSWIERYRGRIPIVHVKDIARAGEKADEDGWADVGAGVLPWAELWTQCVRAGARIMIAEHDNPSDFARFARVSAAAMRGFDQGGRP